jgi:hypothetical protein
MSCALSNSAVGGKCLWSYIGIGMCCDGSVRSGSKSGGHLSG